MLSMKSQDRREEEKQVMLSEAERRRARRGLEREERKVQVEKGKKGRTRRRHEEKKRYREMRRE